MASGKLDFRLALVCFVVAVVLIFGSLGAVSAALAEEERAASQGEKRVIRRSIQPDGSLKIDYSDGSSTIQPKAAVDRPTESADEPAKQLPKGMPKTLPIPQPPDRLTGNTKALEKFSEASTEYYQHLISGYRYRHQVFEWQLFSSRVIFAAVLILVFSGILFAGTQFYVGLQRAKLGEPSARESVTEFEASLRGIKVSSPILGVIILVISLAFFYLYLVYV
jgi:hypothetical protein